MKSGQLAHEPIDLSILLERTIGYVAHEPIDIFWGKSLGQEQVAMGGQRIDSLTMDEIEFRTTMLLECLGEPVRYQIFRVLQGGPKAVCDLARLTKRHPTTICQHLKILRDHHLVRYRNRGIYTVYDIKLTQAGALLDVAMGCAKIIVKMSKVPN